MRFLARLTFICNIFFVICLLIKAFYTTDATESVGMIGGSVIVLGWFISPIMNLAMALWFAYMLLSKKPLPVKTWMVLSIFVCLILQFIVFFILPA